VGALSARITTSFATARNFLLSFPPGNSTVDSRVPLTVTTNWTSLLKK